jgi:hypothetical protein
MSNPYQIRTDLLAMSKEMLDKGYESQMEVARKAMDIYKENTEQALEAWKRYVPKMYTPEEIVSKAEELYQFVTDKGDK